MDEMEKVLSENSARAKERAEAAQRRIAQAVETSLQKAKEEKNRAYRRADLGLGLRWIGVWVLLWALTSAADLGWISRDFALGVELVYTAYCLFYFGAWWQYRVRGR